VEKEMDFWSHTYTDWSQIESPAPHGEQSVHGLNLDWKRFVTYQTIDFFKNEIAPLKEVTPDIPVTTNFMGTYTGLDYWRFAKEVDVVSWDNYPMWHGIQPDWELGAKIGFVHDINRSLKGGKPFMESINLTLYYFSHYCRAHAMAISRQAKHSLRATASPFGLFQPEFIFVAVCYAAGVFCCRIN
jgi:beta-galactosidase GanA